VHAAEQHVLFFFCSERMQQSKTKTAAQVARCDHCRDQDRLHACVVSPLLPVCDVIYIMRAQLYVGSSHHSSVFVNQLCFYRYDYSCTFVFVNLLHHLSEGSDW